MSEIRYDKMHDTHVIIAPERLHRPDCNDDPLKEETNHICPFCEGNESMTPAEIYALRKDKSFVNEPGWHTRVVPNLYKAVQIEASHQQHYGLFEHWEGFGAHEVIIDTPKHRTAMIQWSEGEIVNWLKTLRARVADLRCDLRISHITLFKNEGVLSGSTQLHSHTQLIGLPIVPKSERDLQQRSFEYYYSTTKAMMESIIEHEEEDGRRIVATNGDFISFCPYASAYPFEVIISSKKKLGQIDTLSDTSIEEFAPLLLLIMKKMARQLGFFDFNLSVATPPLQHESHINVDDAFRFNIRIMPRIYRHGGFEASTGVIINPVTPELAAKRLRDSIDV